MATIVAAAGGGNWSATGTWVGSVVPTAADNVQLASTSGNVTIDVSSLCRSLDCTGYTGVLTHAAAVNLSIGDSTAGTSSIALKLVAGMTYTQTASNTSIMIFVSTSATQQTVDPGGKTTSFQFNGAGSSYKLLSAYTGGLNHTLGLTQGTLDTNGQSVSATSFNSNNSNTRTLTLGASALTFTGNVNCTGMANMTVNAGTSSITCVGWNAGSTGLGVNNKTWYDVTMTIASGASVAGGLIFNNLTIIGSATKGMNLSITAGCTIAGTLTLTGNTSTLNRMLIVSQTVGTPITLTCNGTVVATNLDLRDIVGAGSASWDLSAITGLSGDCGGNSGITFTTPVTNYWKADTGNWSSSSQWANASGGTGGTGRVPLPQDSAIFDTNSFTATGKTVTQDMPRFGAVDFSAVTKTFTLSWGAVTIFGSISLSTKITYSGVGNATFGGHGQTVTSNGATFGVPSTTIFGSGGTVTLADNFISSGSSGVTFTFGTLTVNGNFQCDNFTMSGSSNTLNMGTGNWNITGTGAGTKFSLGTGNTVNAGTSNVVLATADTSIRTFSISNYQIYDLTYTVAGSTGQLTLSTSAKVHNINFSDASNARTLAITAATTLTVSNLFNVVGTSGKLMSIISTTSGTKANISKASGVVSTDYLSIKDSNATGGATFYAGANSTNVSNNSGWIFTVPPTLGVTLNLMGVGA